MNKIYLIKSLNEGVYKIGVSKYPNTRLQAIQTGNPSEVQLLYVFESDYAYKIETSLHNRYSHFNTHGEWYELSIQEEISFLKTCAKIEESFKSLKNLGNPFI
jgi:hypothetical protein